jgi:hypothetical protein
MLDRAPLGHWCKIFKLRLFGSLGDGASFLRDTTLKNGQGITYPSLVNAVVARSREGFLFGGVPLYGILYERFDTTGSDERHIGNKEGNE